MSSTAATRSLNDENAASTDGTAASATKKAKKQSPHDLYFEEFNAVLQRENALGRILIRGIPPTPRDNDEDEEDDHDSDEEEDDSKYTSAQMEHLRFQLVTMYPCSLLMGNG